jgi:Asp-tRNA(Asn)/Glu-tRNA(Gln) amidotransferase A subunit family amidase
MAALPDHGTESAAMTMRVAAAVLGDLRAGQMRDRILERAEQVRRVEQAAASAAGQPPPGGMQRGPAMASAEAAKTCRERIEALDADLHAIAWLAPGHPAAASATAAGAALGGFALGVKDIIDVAGMPTRCGSALTAAQPARADAAVVTRLRSAGAALIGKTHCTEWALNDPAPTRNPWDTSRTPGGSSAGSAVAVAAGMCRATVDTQTAGDVLRPAAYTGVVGFKPSSGWAPLDGVTPVAPTIDTIGITARHLGDAAAVAAAIADDPASLTATASSGPPRIGVLSDAFFGTAATATLASIARTIEHLEAAGAVVVELRPTADLTDVHAAHRLITFAECAWQHRTRYRDHRQRYGTRAQELIDLGLTTLAHAYLDAQRVRRHAAGQLARLFDHADILAMPVTPEPAPARTATGDPAFQIPWTLCGFPALSLPTGVDHGLPQAIQIVGPPHRDAQLLAASRWCEQVIGARPVPPLPPDPRAGPSRPGR